MSALWVLCGLLAGALLGRWGWPAVDRWWRLRRARGVADELKRHGVSARVLEPDRLGRVGPGELRRVLDELEVELDADLEVERDALRRQLGVVGPEGAAAGLSMLTNKGEVSPRDPPGRPGPGVGFEPGVEGGCPRCGGPESVVVSQVSPWRELLACSDCGGRRPAVVG